MEQADTAFPLQQEQTALWSVCCVERVKLKRNTVGGWVAASRGFLQVLHSGHLHKTDVAFSNASCTSEASLQPPGDRSGGDNECNLPYYGGTERAGG